MEHIIFIASWCKPCTLLKKNITTLETDAKLDTTRIRYVDIDTHEGNQEAQSFSVRGVPTAVTMEDGLETKRFVGYRTEEQILMLLK